MDQNAGGQRAAGKPRPAKDQADGNQQQKRAERPGGLFGMHEGKGNAGGDGAEDHCE